MKIQLLHPLHLNGIARQAGDVLDLHEQLAAWLIERGRARPAEPDTQVPAPPAPAAASVEPEPKRKSRRTEE
jgi:hypothetical protein